MTRIGPFSRGYFLNLKTGDAPPWRHTRDRASRTVLIQPLRAMSARSTFKQEHPLGAFRPDTAPAHPRTTDGGNPDLETRIVVGRTEISAPASGHTWRLGVARARARSLLSSVSPAAAGARSPRVRTCLSVEARLAVGSNRVAEESTFGISQQVRASPTILLGASPGLGLFRPPPS